MFSLSYFRHLSRISQVYLVGLRAPRSAGVVVSAPTGSGKTVVGEVAVHLALARGERVVYTTPLKALSNQKHRDLQQQCAALQRVHGSVRNRSAQRRCTVRLNCWRKSREETTGIAQLYPHGEEKDS